MNLFTIGHSRHPFDKFVGLLQASGVKTLVDVRSKPFSRFSPQFNRGYLERELPKHGIDYAFLGEALGGRPTDPTVYKSGKSPVKGKASKKAVNYVQEVDYAEVMKREWFTTGIAQLLKLAKTQPAAIMCAEEDPAHCHRHHLITAYLLNEHPRLKVQHIRGDGRVEKPEAVAQQPPLM